MKKYFLIITDRLIRVREIRNKKISRRTYLQIV